MLDELNQSTAEAQVEVIEVVLCFGGGRCSGSNSMEWREEGRRC